jgi:uncharacterized membrane protein
VGRAALLVLLTAGMVVSHYSTTYTMVTVFGGAVVVQLVVARYHRIARFDTTKVVALVTAAVLGFGWYQLVTDSTAHVAATASQLLESGLQILPSSGEENPLQAYLRGPKPPKSVTVAEYQAAVAADYRNDKPWVVVSPADTDPRWALAAPPAAAPVSTGRPSLVLVAAQLASLVFSQLLVLLAVAATAVLLLRRRYRGRLLDAAILALPSIGLLAMVRVSSALASSYGQDRLYIQLMPIVAVPVLWGMGTAYAAVDRAVRRATRGYWDRWSRPARRIVVALTGLYVVFLVAISAGLPGAAVGDHSAANLFNGGEHYARFYVTAPEVAAAQWLGDVQPVGALTYTDEYGQLRIFGYGRPSGVILTDVTPRTIDVNSWVYGTSDNVVSGQARTDYADQQIVYVFPRPFLVNQLGVVYSDGASEVYHR